MNERTGEEKISAPQDANDRSSVLLLQNITKAYGPTLANSAISLGIDGGEIVGLIGANGAGKSTLMRVLAGVTVPDSGLIEVAGRPVELPRYSPIQARALGIRFVHQELSLCDNLSVVENFYLEAPGLEMGWFAWRSRYRALAKRNIDDIFPRSTIDVAARLGDLPIAQRQMVEIARASSDPSLKLLILDEPTSSLDAQRSRELQLYMADRAARGISFIFISHRLREVRKAAGRIVVMRGGRLIWDGASTSIDIEQLIDLMVGAEKDLLFRPPQPVDQHSAEVAVEVAQQSSFAPAGLKLYRGEVIGVAGLEGNGQRTFLRALFAARKGHGGRMISCRADAAYVSGDRADEGIFPLWSVLWNATLSYIALKSPLEWLNLREERDAALPWMKRVQLDLARAMSVIPELSGGNQQKALVARALIGGAEVLILDDPTRGVDVAVKRELYRLIAEAAASGKLVIWYSSEDIEFLECTRVLVFHNREIVSVLSGEAISEDAIVGASFQRIIDGSNTDAVPTSDVSKSSASRKRLDTLKLLPFVTMAAVYIAIAMLNHDAATLFGVDLLMSAAVPLALVAIGQMFVIGGSEIDLSIGAFAGLANVLSATELVERPPLGMLMLAGALAAYVSLGMIIHLRQIPSLVVTLGGSFIWAGAGYALQPTPAGASPDWLSAALTFHLWGLPASVTLVILIAVAAALLNNSRTGVVLRGFGNNPKALEQSGWSSTKYYLLRYLISGTCALLAGMALTGINSASDINAGNPYTLLSVAAVVIGGCTLSGGRIAPVGVVCGAVTLALIGGLLGFLDISSDFNSAVQGLLLISMLLFRTLLKRGAP